MGRRPSLATAFQASGLRRTPHRSSLLSHLCSIRSLSTGPQTPMNHHKNRLDRQPLCIHLLDDVLLHVNEELLRHTYLNFLVCHSSKGEVWWRTAAMSRGPEPEGRLPCAWPWADHGHGGGGRRVTMARDPGCHFWFLVKSKGVVHQTTKGWSSTSLKRIHI